MIKYLGSKRVLLPKILEEISKLRHRPVTVLDLFSGTARVGRALKGEGYQVYSNDHNEYAYRLAECYVEVSSSADLEGETASLIGDLKRLIPTPGYFTQKFCEEARFFQPHNGVVIDATRAAIARWRAEGRITRHMESILIVSLMEAADRVDSTCGLQMAYLKQWSKRSFNKLEMRVPAMSCGFGKAYKGDAVDVALKVRADVAYLDPPYTSSSYRSLYHVWETLALGDAPEHYGMVNKRLDCKTEKSDFNSKKTCYTALKEVVDALAVSAIVLSYSDEGHLTAEQVREILKGKAEAAWGGLYTLREVQIAHERYVGARIGIYGKHGEKVGKVSHTTNVETLFVLEQGVES